MIKTINFFFFFAFTTSLVFGDIVNDILRVDDAKRKQLKGVQADCIKSISVNPDIIYNFENGILSGQKDIGCFYKCYMTAGGSMTKNGEFIKDVILSITPPEVSQELTKCLEEKNDTDICVRAYDGYRCFVEALKAKKLM